MTAQAGEHLLYKGKKMWMAALPLSPYLENRGSFEFILTSSNCGRGYRGQWEIVDNKLYLMGFQAYLEGHQEVGLGHLFPGQNKVFASWFSGEIRVPQGECIAYVHAGYSSIYEQDLMLTFESGILLAEKLIDNRADFERRQNERKRQK